MKTKASAIKRLTAGALCAMMLFAVIVSTNAADARVNENESARVLVSVDGYEFALMESIDEDYNIIRLFTRERERINIL